MLEFKAAKVADEKTLRKKIKDLEKREARVEVEKLKLERQSKAKHVDSRSNQTDHHQIAESSSYTVKDDSANETQENFTNFLSIPTHNQFQILDQTCSSENLTSTLSVVPCSSLVTTTNMDTACSLKTIPSLHPTSANLAITCSLDTTTSSISKIFTKNEEQQENILKEILKLLDKRDKK